MRNAISLLWLCMSCASVTDIKSDTDSDTDTDTDTDTDVDTDSDTDVDSTPRPPACTDAKNPGALTDLECVNAAPCQWPTEEAGDRFGYQLSAGADINGDGIFDLAIGAPLADPPAIGANWVDAGRVELISGQSISTDKPSTLGHLSGNQHGEYFGESLALIPDTNGDGIGDILIGARRASDTLERAGRVVLYPGQADWSTPPEPLTTIIGTAETGELGIRVSSAGDLNGDGLSDWLAADQMKVLVGTRDQYLNGTVRLFMGTDTWSPTLTGLDAQASFIGEEESEGAGLSLHQAKDVNGDGYDDLAIGAPYGGDFRQGRVYLLAGGAEEWTGDQALGTVSAQTFIGRQSYDACGWSIALGDWNNDNIADLAIGCPLANRPRSNAGEVLIYFGGADLFEGERAPDTVYTGEFDLFELGTGLHHLDDINGDGVSDLAVGSIKTYRGFSAKAGKVHIINGRAGAWESEISISATTIGLHGDRPKDYLGSAISSAHFNGDSYSDLIVGSGFAENVYLFWGEAP